LQLFYLSRDLKKARELAEQMLTLAEALQERVSLLGAHFAFGQTLFLSGELTAALPHFEEGITLYNPHQDQSLFWAGSHAGVQCFGFSAWALWLLGYQDQGLRKADEAIALAQEVNHRFSLGFAFFSAARLHQPSSQVQATHERAEALRELATEQEFPYFIMLANIYRGWVLFERGQREEGLDMLRRGVDAQRASGVMGGRLHFLAVLGEAYGKADQPEAGLAAVDEALEVFQETEDRLEISEPYRVKGELLLQFKGQSIEAEAEECFQHAIDIARSIQAKSLELRAVISLARLWQRQSKNRQAYQLLSEIYEWFTEGFDTQDLQEAKALLNELLW
jgi:tetratricopeptide (TPR) repeat protein